MIKTAKICLKIKGIPPTKEFNQLSFGRQLDYRSKISDFKSGAKIDHLATKRQTVAKALKEFIALYNVDEYYFVDNQSSTWHDDSIEIFYTTK